MSTEPMNVQSPPPEVTHARELAFLALYDPGPRPPGWRLTPRAVVTFVVGSRGETLRLPKGTRPPEDIPLALEITEKYVGERALVERCVVTLAGERGLLLVGEPGTAKSMLSELLAAGVCGTSALTVQGTAGTQEEALRYSWNYALLLARGPCPEALVASPVLTAMRTGALARIEEVTRCLPEVQDALISLMSDRRLQIPEFTGETAVEPARPGFNVIATANLRDRGVSEMSAALKRRFNFETVPPIAEASREVALVRRQATSALARVGEPLAVDDAVIEALVTAFRDLRNGRTAEGHVVEKPATVMSVAEAVSVAAALGLQRAYFPQSDPASLLPGYLLGVVEKDDPKDRGRLLAYWDGPVKRRSEGAGNLPPEKVALWKKLLDLRGVLEGLG
jgi:MoxR-like ATPase